MSYVDQLDDERNRLTAELELITLRAAELEAHLESITKSRSYKLWQKHVKIKGLIKKSIKNPRKVAKGLKILFTKGPRQFYRKLKAHETDFTAVVTPEQQYEHFFAQHYPSNSMLDEQRSECKSFSFRPKISIILPTYNTPTNFLKSCLDSVLAQSYDNWELCLCDDASPDSAPRKIIKEYAALNPKIKYVFSENNGGIATASNAALALATGEFIGLLDHDDILWPNALYEVALVLNHNSKLDFIYTDEDQLSADGKNHHHPFFKPDWSPDLLFSSMYTGHFTVYRKELVNKIGNFNSEFDFSQDYDLALRMSEATTNIYHLPRLLYSWRVHPVSAAGGGKPYARETNIKALGSSMKRRGYKGNAVALPMTNQFNYVVNEDKLVSIIIPTDSYDNALRSIGSILKKTKYPRYEVCLVINSEAGGHVKKEIDSGVVRIVPFDKPFNFSKKCNVGAGAAKGEILVILNDDVEILDNNWIHRLIEFFQRKDVGAVSPKLIYEDKTIQYAGMVSGVRGLFGTAFHKLPQDSSDYFNLAQSTRNCSIICGACFAIPRTIYKQIGGFDELRSPINHSDIDLSFKILELGLRIVYTPFTTLLHYGHQSIGASEIKSGKKTGQPDLYMLQRWGDKTAYDPYYPPLMRNLIYGQGWADFKIFPEKKKTNPKFIKSLAFISHETSLTGAPLLIFWLARLLKKCGYYIVFLVPKDGPLVEDLKRADITVIIDGDIMSYPRDETKRFLTNFDTVLCNTIESWKVVLGLRQSGIPVLWYIHESDYGLKQTLKNGLIQTAFKEANITIFANEEIKGRYSNIVPQLRGVSILPGLEEETASGKLPEPTEESRQESTSSESMKSTIIHVGSIEHRKGQDILADAFLALPPALRDRTKLLFVGRTIERDYYRKLTNKAGQHPNISFLSEISHSELAGLYQAAKLFVCSSRDETGPLTVLEAMKYQVPLISSRVGIVPMIIRDKENGLLTDTDNVQSLTEALTYALTNPAKMEKISKQAHADFTETYTLPEYKNRFLKILSSLGE